MSSQNQAKRPFPLVTGALIALITMLGILTVFYPAWLEWGVNDPVAIREHGEIYRLFTSPFLHAGLWHVLLNANLLYVLGFPLERHVGHMRFLLMFVSGGLVGGLAHAFTASNVGLGASGALYAILGAQVVYLHHQRTTLGRWERVYLYGLVALGGAGLIIGFLLESGVVPMPIRAGNGAHLGGLVTGVIMGGIVSQRANTQVRPYEHRI